jgi:hypothetical protein
MAFDRTKSVISVPRYQTDKIIGAFSDSFTIPASSAFTPSQATKTHNTGFGESCLPIGIYSTDSGTTWNDMGVIVPSGALFQTEECTASVSPTGVVTVLGTNWYDTTSFSGDGRPAKTVMYKIWLLAKKDQGVITPLPITTMPLYHSSRFNYQKIMPGGDGSKTLSVSAGNVGQESISHNLGYVPNVRTWVDDSGTIRMNVSHAMSGLTTFIAPEIRLDNNDMIIYRDNGFSFSSYSVNILYRIYLDG